MERPVKIKEYLDTVCNQIRCKKVHGLISIEIENHINDQKEAYKAKGMADEAAIVKAVEQMGDPVLVGAELDRTHRPKPEWSMIILTSLLLLAGILIRFFTSPQSINGIENYYRQLLFTAVGIGLMVLFYSLDFTLLGQYPKLIFFSLAALTPFTLVMSRQINGQYTYLTYLILLFPTTFAGIVYSMRSKGYWGIVICGLYFCIPLAIAFIAPSVTSMAFLSLTCLLILTTAILKNWFNVKRLYAMILVYVPTTAVLAFGLVKLWERIKAVFIPYSDSTSYWLHMIRQILSGAQFTGQGTIPKNFEGEIVSQILPSINDDFLLTYSIHRFGWLVCIMITALLVGFIIRALILCAKQKSVLATLVSLAVILTIGIQTFFYIVPNLGLTLFSPLSLPFISQGNSFLLINMCLAGVLLSVFKTGYFIKDGADSKSGSRNVAAHSFMRFEDGKLIIDFKIHD